MSTGPNLRRIVRARRLLQELGHGENTLAALEELATARKDAERYRWLREGCNEKRSVASRIASDCFGLEWDAKIDAAMAKEGKG